MAKLVENVYVADSRTYNVERLWSLVSRRKPKRIQTDKLKHIIDSKVWYKTPREIIRNKNGSHWYRINNANMKYPILIDEDYCVVDGCHRLCKAYIKKQKSIRVHFIKQKDLQKVHMKGTRT